MEASSMKNLTMEKLDNSKSQSLPLKSNLVLFKFWTTLIRFVMTSTSDFLRRLNYAKKQYEYFREKLLTFVAEGEYTESRVE